MTDMAIGLAAAGERARAVHARTRKRYRAEARFRAYGIGAVAFAGLALLVLVGDIVSKAMPAFTISEIELAVTPTAENLGIEGTPDAAAIARSNLIAPVRQALLQMFPEAVSDRKIRTKLYGILSSDGAAPLRDRLTANPALLGTTVTVPVLLSDDADLFYKGYMTALTSAEGTGSASPSATTGEVTILSSANDFSDDLVSIKRGLSADARSLSEQRGKYADLLARNAADLEAARAAAARNPADGNAAGGLAKLEQDKVSLDQTIGGLDTRITDLRARFDAAGSAETLTTATRSLFVEINGGVVKVSQISNDRISGTVLIPLKDTTAAAAGTWRVLTADTPEASRKVSDQEVTWLEHLREKGLVHSKPNLLFFTTGDSREAELAGVLGAIVGSALTMLVTLIICLPVGVAAAIYLEEFAPKNRITEIIEVNINNLAAVPSIVFGLLGLAVFLNFFGLPRSAPLVGGLVLALLVLPTIIIASRAALKAVPPSIREGALGVGASHQQAVFHHVLPLAMPGILTGTIIGMGHALGETAPLLLIGMVAFIVDIPAGITQAATVLPVQIYLWSDLPEVGFQAKTSAAIIVLLVFLFIMNGAAIVLRKRFEKRW